MDKNTLEKRALCGGKAAGRDLRNHLRSFVKFLGFESCLADPDVWMRPAVKANGQEYCECVLLHTDDCLCISDNAENILRTEMGKYFSIKEESIGPPKLHLGGHLRKVYLRMVCKPGLSAQHNVSKLQSRMLRQHWRSKGRSCPAEQRPRSPAHTGQRLT